MAVDEGWRQAELAAERPHLVLEQFAQRLDQLEPHPLRQPADIVVRLDGRRWSARERHALDDIWIERALGEEVDLAEVFGFLLEHFDEQAADGLALRFRVGDTVERREETGAGIDRDEREVDVAAEQNVHLRRTVMAIWTR